MVTTSPSGSHSSTGTRKSLSWAATVVAVANGTGNGARRIGDGPILAKNVVAKIRRIFTMEKVKLNIITLTPARELIEIKLPILCKGNQAYIVYENESYKIHPEKVFLKKGKPTIILNPFMQDMLHKLTKE